MVAVPDTIRAPSVQTNAEPDDPEWDRFVLRTPGAHYFQSPLWARIKAEAGWRATRVVVSRGGRVLAGAQVLIRPLPVPRLGTLAYVPKGPLVADDDPRAARLVLEALGSLGRRLKMRYLAIQPPFGGDAVVSELAARGFRPNPRLGTATATLAIDLTNDPAVLLAQMRKSTRQNIRRGEARSITVRVGDERDLGAFHAMLLAAGKRKGFPVHGRSHYSRLWRTFHSRGHAVVLVAEYDGAPVSAMLGIGFGDTMYSHASAWSGDHAERKPNEVLEWAAMRWARDHGYRTYDFEGVDPEAAARLRRGEPPGSDRADRMVTPYKAGFGGDVRLLPAVHERVTNAILRWGHRTIYPRIERARVIGRLRGIVVPPHP